MSRSPEQIRYGRSVADEIVRNSTLNSVTNAVRVLKSFSTKHQEWGVSDMARHLGLSKSTTHRLLATLAEEGMLDQSESTGRYRLGLAVFDLAAAVPTQFDLHEAVLTPMTELRSRTGETVQVAVLDGLEVVYIERLDAPGTTRMFLQIGRRNWAHCSSTGKVLLAALSRSRLDWLLRNWDPVALTEDSITDRDALSRELEEVRHAGFAINDGEAEGGVSSIGAPIRDSSGRVIAALSLVGSSENVDRHNQRLVQNVIEAATSASRRLGHRGVA